MHAYFLTAWLRESVLANLAVNMQISFSSGNKRIRIRIKKYSYMFKLTEYNKQDPLPNSAAHASACTGGCKTLSRELFCAT